LEANICFSFQFLNDFDFLENRFAASVSVEDFRLFSLLAEYEIKTGPEKMKAILGLKRKPKSLIFENKMKTQRVFPNSFAPVIVLENEKRLIKPMRYRIRLAGMPEEIPSKYNVFNARVDALEKRQTWKKVFMKQHCLIPFVKFYEWVKDKKTGKKVLITFNPGEREIMWAPAVYDEWTSKNGDITFQSFALLTHDPPPEISAQGHDRCPIFFKEEYINDWLSPAGRDKKEIYHMLNKLETVTYSYVFAA